MNPVVFNNKCSFDFNNRCPLSVSLCGVQICIFFTEICSNVFVFKLCPYNVWKNVIIFLSCLYIFDYTLCTIN